MGEQIAVMQWWLESDPPPLTPEEVTEMLLELSLRGTLLVFGFRRRIEIRIAAVTSRRCRGGFVENRLGVLAHVRSRKSKTVQSQAELRRESHLGGQLSPFSVATSLNRFRATTWGGSLISCPASVNTGATGGH